MRYLWLLLLIPCCACSHQESDARGPLEATAGPFTVVITTDPDPIPTNEHFGLEIEVRGSGSGPFEVRVDADMPEHRHGINTEPRVTPLGNGRFRAEGILFHMPGAWELYVDVTRDAVHGRATYAVEIE